MNEIRIDIVPDQVKRVGKINTTKRNAFNLLFDVEIKQGNVSFQRLIHVFLNLWPSYHIRKKPAEAMLQV